MLLLVFSFVSSSGVSLTARHGFHTLSFHFTLNASRQNSAVGQVTLVVATEILEMRVVDWA